jgi:AcrR family transcriptional regulator
VARPRGGEHSPSRRHPRFHPSRLARVEPLLSSSPRTKPTGRVEIEEAVIIAAADQLASLGPSEMTVRGVAEAAGVNHALVHRHLQTKERVVKGALERMAAESFEEVQGQAGGRLRLTDYPRVRRYVIASDRQLHRTRARSGNRGRQECRMAMCCLRSRSVRTPSRQGRWHRLRRRRWGTRHPRFGAEPEEP